MGDKERKVGQENTEESMSVRKYDEKEESEHWWLSYSNIFIAADLEKSHRGVKIEVK